MDPLIGRAASTIGLAKERLFSLLPSELTMWVDPFEVSYRIGEDGSICVLYESAPPSDTNQTAVDSCKDELRIRQSSPSKSFGMMTCSSWRVIVSGCSWAQSIKHCSCLIYFFLSFFPRQIFLNQWWNFNFNDLIVKTDVFWLNVLSSLYSHVEYVFFKFLLKVFLWISKTCLCGYCVCVYKEVLIMKNKGLYI